MKPVRPPSIRSRLILLVMGCIIPGALMVAALISYNYYQSREQLIGESIETARAMMSAVDRDLAGTQAALLALATSPYLASNDLSVFYRQAQDVVKTLNVSSIVLIDPAFQQRMNTLRPYGSALPFDRSPAVARIFQTGRPVTSDIMAGELARKYLLATGVPVRRDGSVIYAIAATLRPERLSALLTAQRLPAGWIGEIFDSRGTMVTRTYQMEQFVGTKATAAAVARMAQAAEGSLEAISIEGVPTLSVYSRSAISSWTVGIEIPLKTLADEITHTLWWLLAGMAILLLGSLAFAWAIGGRIATSIRTLGAQAHALGYGKPVALPALHLKEIDDVGKALTRASRLLADARHGVQHDALTGLANRALLDEIFSHQIAVCERAGNSLAVLCIGLDGFKAVNDRHGREAGDELLRTAARRLKTGTRASDVVARLGGDELAVVLVHSGLEAAALVAAKLAKILSLPCPIGPLTVKISASIGIAAYPESGRSAAKLLHAADEAMHAAKRKAGPSALPAMSA